VQLVDESARDGPLLREVGPDLRPAALVGLRLPERERLVARDDLLGLRRPLPCAMLGGRRDGQLGAEPRGSGTSPPA